MKRTTLSLILSAALIGTIAPLQANAQAAVATGKVAAGSPSAIVLNSSTSILNTLEAKRADFSRNRASLQSFVDSQFGVLFDRNYAARMVLGKYARGASESDIAGFGQALQGSLMRRYGSALLDFNTKLTVRVASERAVKNGEIVAVNAVYTAPRGQPLNVIYLFRKSGSQWKAFDVVFEGVSMVQTFRDQFAGPLSRKSIAQVTSDLRAGKISAEAN